MPHYGFQVFSFFRPHHTGGNQNYMFIYVYMYIQLHLQTKIHISSAELVKNADLSGSGLFPLHRPLSIRTKMCF